jgi:hypothetical protein
MSLLFDEESSWPQRLVHIPRSSSEPLTSYRWEPGDRYGAHVKPAYVVLSYTWGRWRLEEGEEDQVRPLPVDGVTWQLPRILPNHFENSKLEQILRSLLALAQDHASLNGKFCWISVLGLRLKYS